MGGAHLLPQVSQCKFRAQVTGLGEGYTQRAKGQGGYTDESPRQEDSGYSLRKEWESWQENAVGW